MEMMHRNDLTYYFKVESVTLEYHNQYVSFNTYSLQSKKKFHSFKRELQSSEPTQFDNLNDIYGLANKYGIRATKGCRPNADVVGNIAF